MALLVQISDSGAGLKLPIEKQQVQIGISGSLKRDMTGSVYVPGKGYPLEADNVTKLLKPTDWNTLRINVSGGKYDISLNGQHVLTFESGEYEDKGPIGLQLHPNREMSIAFRNIRLRKIN